MSQIVKIDSDTLLSTVEKHFKITAGPGAGKTHWLVAHIKNVLNTSTRLGVSKKIACITYSNIAVDTILDRLGPSITQVEVSTIHSFLYKHIVKPYITFIATDYSVNVSLIDGHDDHFVNDKKLLSWLQNHSNFENLSHPFNLNQLTQRPQNKKAIANWLQSINYQLNSAGEIIIKIDNSKAVYSDSVRTSINKKTLDLLGTDILDYKKLYWQEGIIHHDDVLFFSFIIIEKFPFVIKIIQSKFPYFFIDEFQDINLVQLEIFRNISSKQTVCGVIGDSAQSIYGFQGANPKTFKSFKLDRIENYIIENNWRSSDEIVTLLNAIRSDIQQKSLRGSYKTPMILVGDMNAALIKSQQECNGQDLITLSRNNITSNALKNGINATSTQQNLIEELKVNDGNTDRCHQNISCIKAIELLQEKKFKDALKELEKNLNYSGEFKRKNALRTLLLLSKNYFKVADMSLLDFANFIKDNVNGNLAKVSSGKVKLFYEKYTYKDLAQYSNLTEENSIHRTIHKSKGAEFENVLLVLKEEKDIAFLTNPKLEDSTKIGEEHRINYVAVSRAKNKLFINTPTLNIANENLLKVYFDIHYL